MGCKYMRIWNGIAKNDIVYYNDKEYLVLALYEQDEKQMCRLEKVDDESIVLDVIIESCKKKSTMC